MGLDYVGSNELADVQLENGLLRRRQPRLLYLRGREHGLSSLRHYLQYVAGCPQLRRSPLCGADETNPISIRPPGRGSAGSGGAWPNQGREECLWSGGFSNQLPCISLRSGVSSAHGNTRGWAYP